MEKPKIVKVGKLLQEANLAIPQYQRPYKWTTHHTNQLIDDLLLHRKKSAYRLGTLVLHQEKGKSEQNIVDGQQRVVTLVLIALALKRADKTRKFLAQNPPLASSPAFSNKISQANIYANYQLINQRIGEFDAEAIAFFFERCEFVQVVLGDITEAFQFFDSQNARGKDLAPHNLLKAYHLREFSAQDESHKFAIVQAWEDTQPSELADLFGKYLFRIRNWSKRRSAYHFSKDDIGIFKGINLEKDKYPHTKMARIANQATDAPHLAYPFQLDQTIVNGRRFFEMIGHYLKQKKELDILQKRFHYPNNAYRILNCLNTYNRRLRTGDGYLRVLFDCALWYYWDKFGEMELPRAIEKIFIWAYHIRLTLRRVAFISVDNRAIETDLFTSLYDAITPQDFFARLLPPTEIVVDFRVEELEKLYIILGVKINLDKYSV